ncbi:hypothetical protein WISP_08815 [Willisornis vidua]|uniref:Uncharacterized protein n=1 Tax=Willisornis vidua TaxID=1566151 RepID=A0ABQ9DV43_9PASS|nr:hypothetical protein WISP_08815 [Willisornis vidua]
MGKVFHLSDHLCDPSVDLLQQVHVFSMLRITDRDGVLHLGSYENRTEGQNHLPQSVGHTAFEATQDAGCPAFWPISSHCCIMSSFSSTRNLQVLCRAALSDFILSNYTVTVFIYGIALTQVQYLALGDLDSHVVAMGPLLKFIQVPLDGIPSFGFVNCTAQFHVICKLAEGTLSPTLTDEDIEERWSQDRALRDTTYHQIPSGYRTIDHNSGCIHPVNSLSNE